MSSKKARRRKRKEQEQDVRPSRFSPVTLFMLSIGLVICLIVVAAVVFEDRSGHGEPPWPGAVWSNAHDHWH